MSWMSLSVFAYFITGLIFAISVFYRGKRQGGGRTTARALILGIFAFSMLTIHGDTVWDLYITVLQTQDLSALKQQEKEAARKVASTVKKVMSPITKKKDKTTSKKTLSARERRIKRNKERKARRISNPPKVNPARRNIIAARTAKDRKYELLKELCWLAVLLYILTRPHLWGFVERMLNAWKGHNTLEHRGVTDLEEGDDQVMGMGPGPEAEGPPGLFQAETKEEEDSN